MTLVVPRELLGEMIEHAIDVYPEECCGFLAVAGDNSATEVIPMVNVAHDWARLGLFEMDMAAVLDVRTKLMAAGTSIGVIYHSHPSMAAIPSGIDTEYARNWPGIDWLILSLSDTFKGSIKVGHYSIDDEEKVTPVEFVVV